MPLHPQPTKKRKTRRTPLPHRAADARVRHSCRRSATVYLSAAAGPVVRILPRLSVTAPDPPLPAAVYPPADRTDAASDDWFFDPPPPLTVSSIRRHHWLFLRSAAASWAARPLYDDQAAWPRYSPLESFQFLTSSSIPCMTTQQPTSHGNQLGSVQFLTARLVVWYDESVD
jgi:hypothetical protein